ncbi:MAG: response regulator [Deltaproteobacteria bacterium]
MEAGDIVLVATASENLRRLIGRELVRKGFVAESADTAEQALQAAACGSYAVIVADAYLPGCTGPSLIHDLRARGITTPAVLLTEADSKCLREAIARFGATDCLNGPDLSRLTLAIAQARQCAIRSNRPN